ncbi:MAG TPA: phosphoribosyltransferase family protein [Pyrinomonadaceae bacterium]|nr:phosphoribosyltransferase family protein [Pyrinomonadaceae bacterium]
MFLTTATDLIVDGLLALVYPQACALCKGCVSSRRVGIVCAECWQATRLFSEQDTICWKCGAPSLGTVALEKRTTVRCRRCDEDGFTVARACGDYAGALQAVVLALKREPNVSQHLLNLLAEAQRRPPLDQATLVIPVPLHPDREKERGFNQAAIIAEQLARRLKLPFVAHSLVRTTHSERHRAGMDANARHASVANAFAVRYPRLVHGEKVLLVDDVFTTGATVSACAEALLAADAAAVLVLTIARA